MASSEIDDKKRLLALADSIRAKYKCFRLGEANYEARMERKFKPLLKKPEKIGVPVPSSSSSPVIDSLHTEDTVFGLKRNRDGSYYLGDYKANLSGDTIVVAEREYPLTRGLLSLLTRKVPVNYSDPDEQHYKQMSTNTRAHLQKSDQRVKTSGGVKASFIRKLFDSEEPTYLNFSLAKQFFNDVSSNDMQLERLLSRKRKTVQDEEEQGGKGISWVKLIKDRGDIKKSYTYWDDPKELVDRLVLLHASLKAGNDSVSGEIYNIESELREAGYIL